MFKINLRTRDGASIVFDADTCETILDAAARSQILLPSGCREGSCGTCRVTCNEGEVALDLPKDSALSDLDRAAGDILLCCARALTDLKLIAPFDCAAIDFSSLPLRSARILEKSPAGANAMRLVLQQDDDPILGRAASFTPGQFLELSIPETSTTRIYSLANTPNSEGVLEFLIRLYPGGAFSNWLEGSAKIGDRVLLRGPKGSFTMDVASDGPRWFVAGGTGLAPILSMLRQMARSGDQRRSRLFFGVNIENEIFALSAIDELKRALPRLRTTICVWMPGSEWRGFVGTPADALALALADEGSRPDVYVCGPPALIEATKSVSVSAGIGRDRVFSEQFSPS